MNQRNVDIHNSIVANKLVFGALRRNDIAGQFRKALSKSGLTVADIAERLNVSSANVSRWLRGDQNLTLDTMYALADAMEEKFVLSLCKHTDNGWSLLTDYFPSDEVSATVTESGCILKYKQERNNLNSYHFLASGESTQLVSTEYAMEKLDESNAT